MVSWQAQPELSEAWAGDREHQDCPCRVAEWVLSVYVRVHMNVLQRLAILQGSNGRGWHGLAVRPLAAAILCPAHMCELKPSLPQLLPGPLAHTWAV